MDLNSLPVVIDESQRNKNREDGKSEGIVELERAKNERLSVIPDDYQDEDVRRILKQFHEPETLLDEDEESRRDRLAKLLFSNKSLLYHLEEFNPLNRDEINDKDIHMGSDDDEELEDDDEEDFYTPANQELIKARKTIISYSLKNTEARLKKQRSVAKTVIIPAEIQRRRAYNKTLQTFSLMGSQVASTRPISRVSISLKGDYFATGSWAGDIKLFNSKTLEPRHDLSTAHSGKIGGLDWNSSGTQLVSGAEDTFVKIHNYHGDSQTLQTVSSIKAHEQRVVTTKFHPSDRYIASTSFDTTWKLWDVETSKELLLQEGHAKEVYSLAFHHDGALVCTGGLDNLGMVWDIRSGSLVMTLSGHVKSVYAVDWSPNGYNLATAGGDGAIHIWDMRNQRIEQKILAHKSIISSLQFEPTDGKCLISSSYDKFINVYSCGDWNKIVTLQGHTDKILDATLSNDSQYIISSGWDRSVKLWQMASD
ncbi:U4/U6 small nuclear ribonucleoprotein Prp4p [Monosporozyma unispora]